LLVADPCPSDEELAAFVDGSAGDDDAARIEAHIDGCATCHRVLAVFAHPGELRSLARLEAEAPRSGAAAEVVARLQLLRPLLPGTRLGRFVVLEWVGEGAAGVVYAAYDPELDRKVALKLMHPPPESEGADARERVIAEARAMGRAANPHVVTVHDVGTFEGRVFIAMEFVEGTTLRSWVRGGKRSVAEILQAYTEAGRGLAAAHAAGVVHRDFKPSNVLRGDDGRVRVTDFGLARPAAAADGAKEQVVSGTPAYMAPEQLTGGRVDERSDQFGFCVALYEALYGEPPFTVPLNEALTTGARTAVRDPPPGTKVTPWTRRCVLRGLEPDPDDRHAGMTELLEALAHDPSVARRRRTLWLGVAVLAVSLVVAAALARHNAMVARREVCAHADSTFAALWSDDEQKALATTFSAVTSPYAAAVWPRVRSTLDRFRAAWTEDRTRTCQAVLERSGPAAVASDEHIACLDDRLREVRALLDDLATVKTAEGAFGGLAAAASLPAVSSCDGAQHGAARGASAADPARLETVRTALARADVLDHADRVKEAQENAAVAADTARELGDEELLGQSLLRRAAFANEAGQFAEAETFLREGLVAAAGVGDDTLRATLLSVYVFVSGYGKHDLPAARQWHDEALAILRRIGPNDHLEGSVRDSFGMVLWSQGQLDEALRESEAAVASVERLGDPLNLSTSLGNLAIIQSARADYPAATRTFRRAVDVGTQALGPDHPVVLVSQSNLANVLLEELELDAALPIAQHAVAIGNANPMTERAFLETEGEILVELGRPDDALALLTRSQLAQEAAPTPPGGAPLSTEAATVFGRAYLGAHRPAEARPFLETGAAGNETDEGRYVAESRFALAQTLTALHREPARARKLAEDAHKAFDALPYPSPLILARREQVRAWLATTATAAR
jgi:tetratricopeptide (TPR) repeat protein/predicted Ser/Thr protein kinase